LEERQRRATPSTNHLTVNQRGADQTVGDIMMHDINIEEKTNAKCQSLALSLFSSI